MKTIKFKKNKSRWLSNKFYKILVGLGFEIFCYLTELYTVTKFKRNKIMKKIHQSFNNS